MTLTLSTEQQRVVSAATTVGPNLLISAVAGGAKTTTLIECAKAIGPSRSILFLAFNKDIAEELRSRVPYHATALTFHSFCYDALGKFLGRKPKVDGNRTKWMLKTLVPEWKERREVEESVLTLVSRAKSCGYATASSSESVTLPDIADRFNIDAGTRAFALAEDILTQCSDPKSQSVDFDDMLWLTLLLNVPFPHTSVIMLDEAQDTNGVQRALLASMLGTRVNDNFIGLCDCGFDCGYTVTQCPQCLAKDQETVTKGRLIAVGDPHQSIYGFRGADSDAMTALREAFNMQELELSVSYRCSKAVVSEAQKYCK